LVLKQTTSLTDDETLTLMMALTSSCVLTSKQIAQGLDCDVRKVWQIANRLTEAGALTKPRYGQWAITEKGRIACALALYKDPSLQAAFFDEEDYLIPNNT